MTKQEVKCAIRQALQTHLEAEMVGFGFKRQKTALLYRREKYDAVQSVEFGFEYHPPYLAGIEADLIPRIEVEMHELTRIVEEMRQMGSLRMRGTEVVLNLQFQNIMPKGPPPRWFIDDVDTAEVCILSVRDSLREWVIPFLEEYTKVDAMITGYERPDDRLHAAARRRFVYVAAAYLLRDQAEKAVQVLETHLGRRMLRREYSGAFELAAQRMKSRIE